MKWSHDDYKERHSHAAAQHSISWRSRPSGGKVYSSYEAINLYIYRPIPVYPYGKVIPPLNGSCIYISLFNNPGYSDCG